MPTFTVAFYEVDRAYGGPEEGGWWFDCGDLRRIARTFKSEDAAFKFARRANRLLSFIQRRHRSTSSAAYDGGIYAAHVYDTPPPPFFPATKPIYE